MRCACIEYGKILLFGDDDYVSYEAASRMVLAHPKVADKIVLHCHNLRFMRAMRNTELARRCITFNSYNFAASSLVNSRLTDHFSRTVSLDTVVIAGFGRFGQTILEEMQRHAADQLAQVALIDTDANRRIMVVDEQQQTRGASYEREVFQGDLGHPEVWQRLASRIDLSKGEPVVILGTGHASQNLRTGVWIKQNYPNTLVLTRTNDHSELALQVGAEHGILSISINQLVEDNLPAAWLT